MHEPSAANYAFAGYRVDGAALELRDPSDAVVDISPTALELLLHLIRNSSRIVSKEELMSHLWPDVVVSENSLAQCVWAARKAVGDAGRAQSIIKNVRGRGYRFVAKVTEVAAPSQVVASRPGGDRPSGEDLVGRAEELEALRRDLAGARMGQGRVCLVAGEAGIGKTRLLQEAVGRAENAGFRVLEGRCHDDDGAPPYWPWRQMVGGYAKSVDVATLAAMVGPDAADLCRLSPVIRERLPQVAAAPQRETEDDRYELFQATTDFLLRVSDSQPLLLSVDDAHWADLPSLQLLKFLAAFVARARMVVLVTFRGDEVDEARRRHLSGVLRQPAARQRKLSGLSTEDVAALLEHAGHAASPRVLERVASLTAGNPFFVTQFARLIDEAAVIEESDLDRLDVPDALEDVLVRRLSRVPQAAQPLARLCAALGFELSLGDLRRASGGDTDRLLEDLATLAQHRIVQPVPDEVGVYRFAHPLLRETAYRSIPDVERAALHRTIATSIRKAYSHYPAARLDELAHHYYAATPLGGFDEAILYLERAARQSFESTAFEDSVRHCRRALSVIEMQDSPDELRRCQLLMVLGHALRGAREPAEAVRAAFLQVTERAEAMGDAELFADGALGYAGYGPLRLGQLTEMGAVDATEVELLARADAMLGNADTEKRALVLAWLGRSLYHSGETERRVRAGTDAVAMARRLDDPRLVARTLLLKQQILRTPHALSERIEHLGEAIEIARRIGAREVEIDARYERAWAYTEAARFSDAEADVRVVGRIADELHQPSERRPVELWNLVHDYIRENVDEVEARDSEHHLRQRHSRASQGYSVRLMMARYIQGRATETLALMEGYAERFPLPVSWQCGLASTYATVGRLDDARRVFESLAATGFRDIPMTHDWMTSHALLSNACQLLGDHDRARILRDRLRPFEGNLIIYGIGSFIGGMVARNIGDLSRLLGDFEDADRCYDIAEDLSRQLGSPSNVVWVQVDRAELLLARGRLPDRKRAEQLLVDAEPEVERLGLGLLRQRITTLRSALGLGRASGG